MEPVTKVPTWGEDLYLYSTEHPEIMTEFQSPDRCKIYFVKMGSGLIKKDNLVVPFEAGSLLFFTHISDSDLQIDDSQSFQCCGLYFTPSVINDGLTFPCIDDGIHCLKNDSTLYHDLLLMDFMYGFNQNAVSVLTPSKTDFAALLNLFYLLHEQLHLQTTDYWPARSRSYLIQLLFLIQTLHSVKDTTDLPQSFPTCFRTNNATLRKILAYMDCHIASKITLTDLGRLSGLNRNQINDLFHKEFNCTFMQYLINLRMDFACSLLRNTDLKQKDIAMQCGFPDYGHFCKSFKKIFKVPPKTYRNYSTFSTKSN